MSDFQVKRLEGLVRRIDQLLSGDDNCETIAKKLAEEGYELK